MTRSLVLLAAIAMPLHALAAEPVGCDKFKWPLDRERAEIAKAVPVASGTDIAGPLAQAVKLTVQPFAQANLPSPPTRQPKRGDAAAGFIRAAAPATAGRYRFTLSAGAWIDVFQGGHALKPVAFSGATGCEGARKSVKFDLAAEPLLIEISDAASHEIGLAITPD
jgi:hypothetical protein